MQHLPAVVLDGEGRVPLNLQGGKGRGVKVCVTCGQERAYIIAPLGLRGAEGEGGV